MVSTSATGIGTHLGQFSLTQQITGNFTNVTSTGSGHWVAANGDSIDTTIAGQANRPIYPVGLSNHGHSHHYWGNGSIHGSPGELYRGALYAGSQWVAGDVLTPTSPAHSTGPLLPQVQLTEKSQYLQRKRAPQGAQTCSVGMSARSAFKVVDAFKSTCRSCRVRTREVPRAAALLAGWSAGVRR